MVSKRLAIPQSKRILITGSSGFIGSHLVARLQSSRVSLLSEIRNRKDCDLRDFKAVRARIEQINPSIVVHLAASPDLGQKTQGNYQEFHNTVSCTLNILNAIPSSHKCLFIHVGSYKQYGNIPVPFHESDEVNPISIYGLAKDIAEKLVRVREDGTFRVVCLRLGPVFGPRQSSRNLIPRTILSVLNKRTEHLLATDMLWDPVYVSDAVKAILLCMSQAAAWGHIMNISGGIPYTPREIMYQIAELMNVSIELKRYKGEDNNYTHCWGDTSQAEGLLGWKPEISLRKGLKLTIDYFVNSYK